MNVFGLMQLLGTAPLFASRAFLAAFLVAVTSRFGGSLPFLADSSALQTLQTAPPWFTSNIALIVLCVLAVLEALAERNLEARRAMMEVGPYIKLAAALAINLGLTDSLTAAILQNLSTQQPGSTVLLAGFDASHLIASSAALATFWLAILRKRALSFLMDADDEDDLGLQGALRWVESAFVVGGIAALAVFPALAIVLMATTAASLLGVERWTSHRETSLLTPCGSCGLEVHPSAPTCSGCQVAREPVGISALGQPLDRPAGPRHAERLLAGKRCPHCAVKLESNRLSQTCAACGHAAFASQEDVDRYITAAQWQLPKTLLVCALFGAVPLIGLIPGIIYYRLSVLSGLRRYLPMGSGIATRWLSRFLTIGLLAFQWVPILGAAMLPILCLANFALYRRALLGAANDLPALSPA
jgi:hypothetical protein